jgi:predicted phage terminase large subunit-like protein
MAFTSMTGSRGDRVIVDDPLSVDDGNSDAALAAAESTFREALPTRVNNDKSAIIVIMQRLHERDTSGIILKEELGYTHLCLPMRFEKTRRCVTSIGFEDPRTEDGELLFTDRFPERMVLELEKSLGEYGTAGQLQQRPSPAGGGVLRIEHFQLWPKDRELPIFDYIVQSYDCAFTEKTTGDPTACTVWGVFSYKGKPGAMLLDAWSDHLGYPALRAKAVEEWHSIYGKTTERKGRKSDVVLVEAKASGQSLLQDLRQANVPAIPYNPGNADKINRAHQAAPILELDCLWIPESNKTPGSFVSWAKSFVDQVEKFPNAEHDDYTDTFTQCMILLRDQGRFDLTIADEDVVEEVEYYGRKRGNPYGE